MNASGIIIHGAKDGLEAIAREPGALLRSAPGAALYAGALWWRELIAQLRAQTGWQGRAYLDCGDQAAVAVEAIHGGVGWLILEPDCPLFAEIAVLAAKAGGEVLRGPKILSPLS
jgi:hypothetical protein